MDRVRDLLFRIWALLNGRRMDREFTEEVAFHLEMETRDLMRQGFDPGEARRRARVAFGGPETYREKARESRGAGPVQDLGKDLQLAFRRLWKAKGTSAGVILSLGLGLGALAGVFPFFVSVLLRPLPFPQEDRLAVLFETSPQFTRASPSFEDLQGWKEEARSFSGLGGWSRASRTLTGPEGPDVVDGIRVSHNLLPILGVAPALGRGFTPEDDGPGAPPSVILSHRLWTQRFSSDPGVLGSSLTMDDVPHTVVGVMPPGFGFPEDARFWVPMRTNANPRGGLITAAVGRMSHGVDLPRAQADMDRVAALMREAYPEANAQRDIAVRPLREDFLWGLATPAKLFMLVAAFILLLSAANVTNMLLAQATARRREMAVRAAIGAGRGRILRHSLAESLILAGFGGLLGATMGWAGQRWYRSLLPGTTPYYLRYEMDAPVLGLLALVTLGTGLVVGLGPALEALRGDPLFALKGGGEGGWKGASPSHRRLRFRILGSRSGLLATQVGLALAVLVGTGMASRSLMALREVDTGLDPENVLTLQIELPSEFRNDDARLRLAFDEIRDRVAALPGVEHAAFVSHLPLLGAANGSSLHAEGTLAPPPGQEPWVITKQSQPGYFQALGIPLVDGRGFSEEDGAPGTPPVIIVNEAFARRYWPSERAVGKRVKYGRPDSDTPWMEVVGVARDVRHFGPGSPVELGIYEPFHQFPYWRETLVVRGHDDPSDLVPAIRAAVASVDPNTPVHQIQTMAEAWYRTNWQPVLASRLLWAASAVALLLASLGVFGVVTYLTGRRRKEFAIRLATGGNKGVVTAFAVRSTLPPVLLGLVSGAAVAWAGARLWSRLLFQVEALDLGVLGLCTLIMVLAVGVAILLPARKAARLDPAEVLRKD